jgi:hypothetical protein
LGVLDVFIAMGVEVDDDRRNQNGCAVDRNEEGMIRMGWTEAIRATNTHSV